MKTCSIPEAIEEIRNGRLIILVDNEDRENEGDPLKKMNLIPDLSLRVNQHRNVFPLLY